jgi:CubicO group peptidase (beta-lactamase class C family)
MDRRSFLSTTSIVAMGSAIDRSSAGVRAATGDDASGPSQGHAIVDWSKELDAYVDRARRDWRAPGAAIAIVQGDAVSFAKGYGVCEVHRTRAVTERTRFAIASTTKAFGAMSLAMLVDAGKLGWDDRVVTLLPTFRVLDPYVAREMTLRDVLSHRTGVRDSGSLEAAYPDAELLRRMSLLEQRAPFRTAFVYNNLLYHLPGAIVEAVTRRPWEEFVRERIFRPLGMTGSATSATGVADAGEMARMHRVADGQARAFAPRAFEYDASSAGSFYSTARDLGAWLQLHIGDGEYRGERLVSSSAMAALRTPAIVEPIADAPWGKVYSETLTSMYALGWQVRDHRGARVVEHGGRNNGMSAHVGYLPRQRAGVVVLANVGCASPGFPDAIAYRVYDRLLGAAPLDWSRRALAEAPSSIAAAEPARTPGTRPSLALDAYTGVYSHGLYGEVRVAVEDGRLTCHWFGRKGVSATLDHWHFDTFRATWRDVGYQMPPLVTFVLDARGRSAALVADRLPATFDRTDSTR